MLPQVKNYKNKKSLQFTIKLRKKHYKGAFIFWFFGFGIAFGKDFGGFIGTSFYFAIDFNLDY